MVWYYYSSEGEKAYKDIGLPYPKTVEDINYEMFLDNTKRSSPEVNKTRILNMIRIKSAFGSQNEGEATEEYIVFTVKETRYDSLGNEKSFTRTGIGRYPVPIGIYRVRRDEQGYEEKYTAGVSRIYSGYSIKFNKETLKKLHNDCIDSGNERTQYYAQVEGEQRTYPVPSFDDFRDRSFEELITEKPKTEETTKDTEKKKQVVIS